MKKLKIGLFCMMYSLLVSCGSDVEIIKEEPKKEKQVTVAFNIKNNATEIATTQKIIITLSEKVFLKNGNALDTNDVEDIISLQLGKTKINYTVEINENGNIITLTANLTYNTKYTLIFNGDKLKGTNTKKIESKTILFTTAKNNVPLSINDPLYKDQWYLKNTGQNGGIAGLDINVEPAWQLGYTGKGIKVGILDILVDANHPDLRDNLPAENVNDYFPKLNNCDRGREHGTNVAGIIAGRDNDIGIRGVAPKATLYAYGVIGNSDDLEDNLAVRALTKDRKEIAVYNNSWGNDSGLLSTVLSQAIDKVLQEGFYGKGSSIVVAAGNGNRNSTLDSELLNHYGVIGVAGADEDGTIEPFGDNFNSYPALKHGPGIWITAFAEDLATTDYVGSCGGDRTGYTDDFGASSGASPQVSGVIALMREANPNLNWRDIKIILAETANSRSHKYKGNFTFKNAGRTYTDDSKFYEYSFFNGFGLVDAAKAVKLSKTFKSILQPLQSVQGVSTQEFTIPKGNGFTESIIEIKGANIKFIEAVTLEMEVEQGSFLIDKVQIELISPANINSMIAGHEQVLRGYLQQKYKIVVNGFLGKTPVNGQWTLRIKHYDVEKSQRIVKLKNWKLTVRGH